MKSCLDDMPKGIHFKFLLLFAAIVIAAISPLTVAASPSDGLIASPEPDWPQWRGPRRDGISNEKGLLESWPEGGPRLLWKIDSLGKGWSCPIIVGQRIYITGDVGTDLIIFALNLKGEIQWEIKNGQ